MILCTDNYQRIYEQMRDERDRTRYYLQKNSKKMERLLRDAKRAPVCYCETITMPKTGNTYLLYYYSLTMNEIMSGSCWSGAPLIMNDQDGHRVAIMLRSMTERDTKTKEETPYDSLQVYSGHFFSRFRERMNISSSISTNELIAAFFGRNEGYFAELEYDKIVLEKNRHKGNSAFGIDDGVTLAEVSRLDSGLVVFKHNTFLSRMELKASQEAATPSQDAMRRMSLAWELQKVVKNKKL